MTLENQHMIMINICLFLLYSKCFIYRINENICEIVIIHIVCMTDPIDAEQVGC